MEHSYSLINDNGIVSFILPHKFLVSDFGVGIRQFFKQKTAVKNLIHFGSEIVFQEASTYTCIVDLTKTKKDKVHFKKITPEELFKYSSFDQMSYDLLSEQNWDLQGENTFNLIEKLSSQPFVVGDVFNNIFQGIATSLDSVYVFKGIDKGEFIEGYNEKFDYVFQIEKDIVKPFLKGNEVSRYANPNIKHYVIFPYRDDSKTPIPIKEDYIKQKLPKTYSYLKHFEKEIKSRERGRMNINENWYLYIYPKSLDKFSNPKIMTQEISLGCNMTYDANGTVYHPTTVYSFVKNPEFEVDEKYYLGILNSKIMWFFLKNTGTELAGGYFRFKTNYLKPFPLPGISNNSKIIIDKVNLQLDQNKSFQNISSKFTNYIQSQFTIDKLTKKLQNWHELEFGDFIKELNKAIKKSGGEKLSKMDEMDWLEVFETKKEEALKLKAEIHKTDKEIDQMVYELYGLTDEEIQIVENS